MVTNPDIEGLTDWRPLARGGFAIVWEARQASLNRLVAVKVDQRKLDSESERQRFLREAGAAGRMSGHPGIVTVHDAGLLPDDRPYLVMELCTGGSLTRRLEPENRPSQEWVRDVGIRIADALAAAHAQGVLHRDVKPANVLIDQYGQAGLADFGLAVLPDPGMELSETLEALTPAYAPPEAFVPHSPTQRGDVYSLAATLYALLCGHAPRAVENDKPDVEVALARLEKPIERIPGVDRGLMSALLAALSDDPEARPSAAEFRDRLEALPLGAPAELVLTPTVRPLGSGESPVASYADARTAVRVAPRRSRRRRWVAPAAVAAAIVVIAAAVIGFGGGGGVATPPPSNTLSVPATSAPVSPSATPTPLPTPPAGFVDCSEQVGETAFCGPTPPQCWGQVYSYTDSPWNATPASCYQNHVYQTFAAGPLDFPVRRKSQLDAYAPAKKLCTKELLNKMLPEGDRRNDWEIYIIPPQTEAATDTNFRCIFGKGERSKPFTLGKPS